MKLNNQQLLEEFAKSYHQDFPGVSFEQLKEVCFGPWRFIKEQMESGLLPSIRLKYFGTFQVYPGRAQFILLQTKKKFEAGHMNEDQYLKYKEMIETYLDKIKDEK